MRFDMAGGTIYGNEFRSSDTNGFQQAGVQIGWSWFPVRLATVGNQALGAGACPANVDGVAVGIDDRIAVIEQTDSRENGVYRVVTAGAGGTWVRADDAATGGQFTPGKTLFVQAGATKAGWTYQLVTAAPITVGVTNLAFQSSGSSAITTLENVIFVDKGVDPTQDGSMAYPFHTVAAAVAVAGAGDTIWIMPGAYNETGLVSKAGVTWQGLGEGQVSISGAGVVLAISHASVYRNLRFEVTDAAALITLTAAPGVAFDRCAFSLNGNNANAITVSAGTSVNFIDCTINQTAANFNVLVADANAGNNILIRRGSGVGIISVSDGALTVQDILSLAGDVVMAGTGALQIVGSMISGVNAVSHTTTGSVSLQDNILTGTAYAVHASVQPASGLLIDNVLNGASGDFAADTAIITYNTVSGNSTPYGFVQVAGGVFACATVKQKNVGGGKDAWRTITHAMAAAASGDEIEVAPGAYAEGAAVTLKDGVTLSGASRTRVTVTRGAALAAFTIGAGVTATVQNMTVVGSIDCTGAGAYDLTLTNLGVTGMLDLQAGGAGVSFVRAQNCKFLGDVTDTYALRFADADPTVFLDHVFLQGAGVAAVYYDGVTNNNLYLQGGCVVAHGALGANPPFARSAAQTPAYYSQHNAYNANPNNPPGPGWMIPQVPLGDQLDSFHPAACYWSW